MVRLHCDKDPPKLMRFSEKWKCLRPIDRSTVSSNNIKIWQKFGIQIYTALWWYWLVMIINGLLYLLEAEKMQVVELRSRDNSCIVQDKFPLEWSSIYNIAQLKAERMLRRFHKSKVLFSLVLSIAKLYQPMRLIYFYRFLLFKLLIISSISNVIMI